MNALIAWKEGITPEPPYYANIFSYLIGEDRDGYDEMDELTLRLVAGFDGYLGYESSNADGRGLFISYWRDLEAMDNWRRNATHAQAKSEGKKRWYQYYHSKVVKIESAHYHELP
ncbi:MAG: antibiotic biosynthesis monooxygenase [Flavobacteriales bacterium]|jgi:heme-degrading monooxygenase HmoA|nr:antibiotic biosynthesis monooxygenase [Flavobacteriales bacterium]NCG30042.1 antibiotic biosynthesis monooxygenase [Bacteroidota bacterium]MBT3963530.1 antibiotic biosynthesis monooxygenase [Flavobacteriales bacterium]MBT4706254.1 antibiotic biosynthesis monooxygenase [Flavobacteriales bacterium]MBT4931429.1 antibiotic biosynthesis monooxygenase [Flavobacteriales bacterium]